MYTYRSPKFSLLPVFFQAPTSLLVTIICLATSNLAKHLVGERIIIKSVWLIFRNIVSFLLVEQDLNKYFLVLAISCLSVFKIL